ncbi:Uncharacterised protein [BD1-7 clade bacterium]|uniref:Uncharacterized protein n=1 Tax=BD1-7 clade bacterium TaxID=2029982 RepID=A0A5S9Q3N2_9GAMM|nr:Uncharacterised protein [BD1-7 clade bacterium]CAA0111806.1 Uncharacterised protein [BD1-7 clade bacterium]
MKFNNIDINELIKMGERMVAAHEETDSLWSAIHLYQEEYPDADTETLALLWMGINSKEQQCINN